MHLFTISTPSDISLVAATAKTVAAIITPATRQCQIYRVEVSFNSTLVTDPAVLCEIVRFTGADGTGTAQTPANVLAGQPAALCSGKVNYTVEPSTPVPLDTARLSPQQGGTLIIPFDAGRQFQAGVSQEIGLRLTSGSALTGVRATLYYEE